MAERSIYSRGGSGMTTGGLDGYLGPEAQDFSSLPDSDQTPTADSTPEVDCSKEGDQAVCQIAEAEKRRSETQ